MTGKSVKNVLTNFGFVVDHTAVAKTNRILCDIFFFTRIITKFFLAPAKNEISLVDRLGRCYWQGADAQKR